MRFKLPKRRKATGQGVAPETAAKADDQAKAASFWRQAGSTFLLFAAAILVALFTKAYIVQPYIVDGQSMVPTLADHDRLLVNKIPRTIGRIDGHAYVPKRGDIIIFNQSGLPGYNGPKQLIKRVVGLPGDRIIVNDGKLSVYNSAHPEGFDPDLTLGYHPSTTTNIGSVNLTLATGQLFVMGDNRNYSEDSRYFGPISVDQIVGKLSFRILPLSKVHHF